MTDIFFCLKALRASHLCEWEHVGAGGRSCGKQRCSAHICVVWSWETDWIHLHPAAWPVELRLFPTEDNDLVHSDSVILFVLSLLFMLPEHNLFEHKCPIVLKFQIMLSTLHGFQHVCNPHSKCGPKIAFSIFGQEKNRWAKNILSRHSVLSGQMSRLFNLAIITALPSKWGSWQQCGK